MDGKPPFKKENRPPPAFSFAAEKNTSNNVSPSTAFGFHFDAPKFGVASRPAQPLFSFAKNVTPSTTSGLFSTTGEDTATASQIPASHAELSEVMPQKKVASIFSQDPPKSPRKGPPKPFFFGQDLDVSSPKSVLPIESEKKPFTYAIEPRISAEPPKPPSWSFGQAKPQNPFIQHEHSTPEPPIPPVFGPSAGQLELEQSVSRIPSPSKHVVLAPHAKQEPSKFGLQPVFGGPSRSKDVAFTVPAKTGKPLTTLPESTAQHAPPAQSTPKSTSGAPLPHDKTVTKWEQVETPTIKSVKFGPETRLNTETWVSGTFKGSQANNLDGQGTKCFTFSPHLEKYSNSCIESFESISSHPKFANLSYEELRLTDYKLMTQSAKAKKDADQKEEARKQAVQLQLLEKGTGLQTEHDVKGTPVFTVPVLENFKDSFSQYGFLAGMTDMLENNTADAPPPDPRVFFNIAAPSSTFICGSQGSGKSHTLACLLENCLVKSDVSVLENPLAGLVFHYDSFTSDQGGSPCEAAFLASNPNIKVRVLCSPANIRSIKATYNFMNVNVEPLQISQHDLNTKRMQDLMAVNTDDRMPLYLHSVNRVLRQMRMQQQASNQTFNYAMFKRNIENCDLTPAQLAPLRQRLDALESFMPLSQTTNTPQMQRGVQKIMNNGAGGNDWSSKPGQLTIVDLSCPCVTPEGACSLFNICLSIFLEQQKTVGRIIALDEAHKFMNSSPEAAALTNTLLSTIRLQRHLGARVIVSTQEPTVSPALLDLCSTTIVHRFSSPEWLRCLRSHLAALDYDGETGTKEKEKATGIFSEIVRLRVGEALLFSPSAMMGIEEVDEKKIVKRLGTDFVKIRVRARITNDGGKSVLADGNPGFFK